MTTETTSGFEEIDHTADLCLQVWGKKKEDLFREALKGLYYCSQVKIDPLISVDIQQLQFAEIDDESLLVSFLSECNYLLQFDQVYFRPIKMDFDRSELRITNQVYRVTNIQREIKAITFHNLKINKNDKGYSALIVFDV
jgi:SHS2 domain-containing protein